VCVTKKCVNNDDDDDDNNDDDDDDDDDDNLESLAVQSGKLSLHDISSSAHTDIHTRTHGLKEGRQWGAQSEGCFMHAYSAYRKRERDRASEISVKRAEGISSRC